MKKAKKIPKKKPGSYRTSDRYGILNHFGDIWTPVTFKTPAEASAYIKGYEDTYATKLPRHKPVRVRVTVTAVT